MSLKGMRRKTHLTQEEVATRLNIPKKTYANDDLRYALGKEDY